MLHGLPQAREAARGRLLLPRDACTGACGGRVAGGRVALRAAAPGPRAWSWLPARPALQDGRLSRMVDD